MYDAIVAGSGFAGSVAARELAEKGKKVLLMEKRKHTGGNMYDVPDENGISVHIYGPHIFHTNSEEVFSYINKFSKWKTFYHRVTGKIDGKFVPIPFNFKSMEMLLGQDRAENLKKLLKGYYPGLAKISVNGLMDCNNSLINELGNYVFEKVFLNYTAKQWGIPAKEVDTSVLNRVPVVLGYEEGYFQDKYQCMPEVSYTRVFENMLSHKNIEVKTDTNALDFLTVKEGRIYFDGKPYENPVIYTGAVDELFNYEYGQLAYRSAKMVFEKHNVKYFQDSPVVNYPNENEYTRITEFRHFYSDKKGDTTTILKEIPLAYDKNAEYGNIPYYIIPGEKNVSVYNLYKNKALAIKNLYLCGRLAEYRYYNMDACIESALNTVKGIR